MILFNLLSFIIDGILSLFLEKNSIFLPLFSLMSLIIIYPYVNDKKNIVFFGCIIGILYDITYTQTLFLNTFVFTLLSFLLILFYKYVPYHIVNSIIVSFILIIMFRTITYLSFIFINDYPMNFSDLFRSIYSSFILNILYVFAMYFLFKLIFRKISKKRKNTYSSTFVRKNY